MVWVFFAKPRFALQKKKQASWPNYHIWNQGDFPEPQATFWGKSVVFSVAIIWPENIHPKKTSCNFLLIPGHPTSRFSGFFEKLQGKTILVFPETKDKNKKQTVSNGFGFGCFFGWFNHPHLNLSLFCTVFVKMCVFIVIQPHRDSHFKKLWMWLGYLEDHPSS